VQYRQAASNTLLWTKSEEYSREHDRLHNFKRAAVESRTTPAHALVGMMTKHWVSLLDIVDDVDVGKLPSDELINEKFTDMHNYLYLLEAIIREEKEVV
jgi:hypothetical protein